MSILGPKPGPHLTGPGCEDEDADAEGEGEEDTEVPGGPGQGLPYRRTGHPLSRLVYAPKAVRWTKGDGWVLPHRALRLIGGSMAGRRLRGGSQTK